MVNNEVHRMEGEDDSKVVAANNVEDPLDIDNDDVRNCCQMTCNDSNSTKITLKHFKVKALNPRQFNWVFGLLERNMKKLYKRSQDGWKERKKKKEMTQETSRYLIAYNAEDKPVAFTHFQFDMDYGRQVLYCYELQLETSFRRFGLGKHIMTTLERIAGALGLSLVVLTVFKHNPNALAFYKSIGYDIDETCPEEEEEQDYLIMSKRMC